MIIGGDVLYEISEIDVDDDGIFVVPDGIESISRQACINNTKLRGLVIPASVKFIGQKAFCGCKKLEAVIFQGDGDVMLDEGVFALCSLLREVELPAGLRKLPINIFNHCLALKQIELPKGIKHIGSFA